jgi:hypothetical protein
MDTSVTSKAYSTPAQKVSIVSGMVLISLYPQDLCLAEPDTIVTRVYTKLTVLQDPIQSSVQLESPLVQQSQPAGVLSQAIMHQFSVLLGITQMLQEAIVNLVQQDQVALVAQARI